MNNCKQRKTRLPSNWRDRIEIVSSITDDGTTTFDIGFKKGQTPRGFCTNIGTLVVSNQFPHAVEDSHID